MKTKYVQIQGTDATFECVYEKATPELFASFIKKALLFGPEAFFPGQEVTFFDMFPPVRYEGFLDNTRALFYHGDIDGKVLIIVCEILSFTRVSISTKPGIKSVFELIKQDLIYVWQKVDEVIYDID